MFGRIGPGALVTAAFIGPGTVTACVLAGVEFGYGLLWVLGLSILATMMLQEMSARLGLISQSGLASNVRKQIKSRYLRNLSIGVILAAIVVGNAAYEGGNIGGGTLGLEALFGNKGIPYYPFIIGGIVFVLLYLGNYKMLEKVFVFLVLMMSLSFFISAMLTKPNILHMIKGLFVPSMPKGSILTVIALVGTTIVPYNLFLHASLVNEKWKAKSDLRLAQQDTWVSVFLGGMVSMAIVISASAIPEKSISDAMGLAKALEPLYGRWAQYCMGLGLFAAGVTSAITAPLAAAYVANSCFGWNAGLKDVRFRLIWMSILVLGVLFMSLDIEPIRIIKFAQIANGIVLPFIAVFLLWAVNRKSVMGMYRNRTVQNILGVLIVLLVIFLGAKSILEIFGSF